MGSPLLLASIESVRPVYLIVMGVSLLIFAWRLSHSASTWAARLMMAGAVLLAIGYAIVMPMYEAGQIDRLGDPHGDPAAALAWHVVKLVAMNTGWLFFGWGLAVHAHLFSSDRKVAPVATLIPTVR
ncbi:MAG: hypothetical protein QM755_06985 [Luteolibacter sp.]